MKHIFKPGDKKLHSFKITEADLAAFHGVVVHSFCATFVLAREIEWTTRLFVLDMKEADEEGIGTRLEIIHKGPAFADEIMEIEAVIKSIAKNEILCTYRARVGERLVAEGLTGQKIFSKQRLAEIGKTEIRNPEKVSRSGRSEN
ncbi:MAG: hypothetical protein WD555_01540 [Fulvivirga sp.]